MEPVRHPEMSAFWMTKVLVLWISPLIKLASQQSIKESDVWECPDNQTVERDVDILWSAWGREQQQASQQHRPATVSRALVSGHGSTFMLSGLYQFCFLCTQLSQPFLVGAIVEFISTGERNIGYGVMLALLLGAVSLTSSFCLASALYTSRRLGIAVRSGVMMAVYSKALSLTSAAKLENTVGKHV